MKVEYKIREVYNSETESTYYWIVKCTTRKFFGFLRTTKKTQGKYIDPHCGMIPFFNKEEVLKSIKHLNTNS